MSWRMSDYFFAVVAIALAMNLLIIFIVLIRPYLEKNMTRQQISSMMKMLILGMLIFIPVVTGLTLYFATRPKVIDAVSDDFEHWYAYRTLTLGMHEFTGNHFIFLMLFFIWGVGFALLGVKKYINLGLALRKIKKVSISNKENLLPKLEQIKQNLQIHNTVELLTSDFISSPFMTGIKNIRIYLPVLEASDSEYELILEHELIHSKNKDYLYRRLLYFLCYIYWFNPFMSVLSKYFVEINEMACDEMVLKGKSKESRILYGNLILKMVEGDAPLQGVVPLTGYYVDVLEKRIRNIMKKTRSYNKPVLMGLTALLLAACPVSVLAASKATVSFQDTLTRYIEEKKSTEEFMQESIVKEQYMKVDRNEWEGILAIEIRPSGLAWVDDSLSGKKPIIAEMVTLSVGDEVSFFFEGDNSSDKFRVGLFDKNGNARYAESSNGEVDYTFRISQEGEYTIFIEGTTDNDVHVLGSITIL